jgi:hypothetical protein
VADADIVRYSLTTGQRGSLDVRSILHVSVLMDGRGVVYMTSGAMLVVREGEEIARQWSARRAT